MHCQVILQHFRTITIHLLSFMSLNDECLCKQHIWSVQLEHKQDCCVLLLCMVVVVEEEKDNDSHSHRRVVHFSCE